MSQRQFARWSGHDLTTISAWVCAKKHIPMHIILRAKEAVRDRLNTRRTQPWPSTSKRP